MSSRHTLRYAIIYAMLSVYARYAHFDADADIMLRAIRALLPAL